MALPNSYKKLKYIQATGTQYINTGVTATANTTAKYKYSIDQILTYGPHVLSGQSWYFPMVRGTTTGGTFVVNRGGNEVGSSAIAPKTGVIYEVDASFINNKVTVNGVEYGTYSMGNVSVDTAALHLMTYGGSPGDSQFTMSGKLYYCQIYESGTLIRDFIPAMRTSDSAVGLYDQANGVFYTNEGSGSFTGFLATGKVEGTGASIIDGASYGMEQGKTLVNGTAYDIKVGKTFIGGTAYDIGKLGIPIGSLAVGTSVYAYVNGNIKEFLIVHKGNPDAINTYDSSCDGTWLLMKDLYESKQFHNKNSGFYNTTDIHAYLNGDFYGLLDQALQNAIKSVKIPYIADRYGTVNDKEYGLSAKVFLLSMREVFGSQFKYHDGSKLSYFPTTGDSARIAYLNGNPFGWWLRTTQSSGIEYEINKTGKYQTSSFSAYRGIRPACIVYPETLVNPSDYTIIG